MHRNINSKQIVFVSTHFVKPRILKMAYALYEKGYEVILFYNKNVNNKSSYKDLPYFHKVYGYGYHTEWVCLLRLMAFSPLVFHVFSEGCFNKFSRTIIRAKKYLGKIVYDEYDMVVDRYKNPSEGEITDEKYCIENADGVCCRSFEVEYLIEEKKYNIKKSIQFFDYCWNNPVFSKTNENTINGFVYVGSVEHVSRYKFCYEEIVNALSTKNIQFHMYPAGMSMESEEFLRKLQEKNETYKLMEPIRNDRLIDKIRCYMAGVMLAEKEWEDEENIFVNKYAVSNRLFDYIDAGLPIISNMHKRLLEFFNQYDVVYFCSSDTLAENLDGILDRLPQMHANAAKCREALDVKKQVLKLIEFYQGLHEDSNK